MYLLIRRISEYTAADVLLGVFRSPEQAESAKATYAKRYSVEPASDPWREQTYREPGLSSRDLVIQEIACELGSAKVFVVSNHSEGFGQVFRQFDSLHGSAAEAHARMAQLDAEEDTFPHYALCQRAVIGVVLSDAPEDQPGLE